MDKEIEENSVEKGDKKDEIESESTPLKMNVPNSDEHRDVEINDFENTFNDNFEIKLESVENLLKDLENEFDISPVLNHTASKEPLIIKYEASEEKSTETLKRKRGRPKKGDIITRPSKVNQDQGSNDLTEKRKRGRPKKIKETEDDLDGGFAEKRSRGRPKKQKVDFLTLD